MDTYGPIHPALKQNSYDFVFCDASTRFANTKLTGFNDAEGAADILLKQ